MKIHINKQLYETDENELSASQILQLAGFDPSSHDLFLLQGEGDPTGGKQLGDNETVEIKNGMHFRVMPKNPNFGYLYEARA